MAFSFTPSDANSINVAYGVDNEVTGYIVQNEDISENMENLTIADQKGRVCQVIAYDKGKTLSLTIIGPAAAPTGWAAGASITYNSETYIIQTIRRTCVYNDTAKWQIEANHWAHATYSDKSEDSL